MCGQSWLGYEAKVKEIIERIWLFLHDQVQSKEGSTAVDEILRQVWRSIAVVLG